MSKIIIKPEQLADAIQQELTTYNQGVIERVNEAGKSAAAKLKKLTQASAPKRSGDYRKSLAIKEETDPATGMKKFVWYAKAPHHRLTHLLVKGHPTGNGGWADADPFLSNALDTVLPEYEEQVKEAVQSD